MSVKKRIISAVVIAVILVIGVVVAYLGLGSGEQNPITLGHKETIRVWYTDDTLTDFLNSKAVSYYEENDVRVETKLVSGLEYLEAINTASVADDQLPDVYILTNDSLEKAYLAGLASEVTDTDFINDNALFCNTARYAVSYDGKYIAYPMYFETAALLYNQSYLEQIAEDANTQSDDEDEEEEEVETEAVAIEPVTSSDLIPTSVLDILNIADQYSVPENVESFFRWDVSDIFYNYFFIGSYISVGGDAGDDKDNIDIYNADSIASLSVYQDLNQFFAIEAEETNYASIIQEFLEGKTIYTIATSDCLATLEQAKKDGTFAFEYGIATLPDINEELSTRGMSVTNTLVVNGYSIHKEQANSFARYVSEAAAEDLYTMSGKLPVIGTKVYDDAALTSSIDGFEANYAESAPIPKMIETMNFWVELETTFSKVWGGQDANEELKALGEQILTQISGTELSLEYIEATPVELLPADESN